MLIGLNAHGDVAFVTFEAGDLSQCIARRAGAKCRVDRRGANWAWRPKVYLGSSNVLHCARWDQIGIDL